MDEGIKKVIVDCSGGADQALGLAYAAACREELEIIGITVSEGNALLADAVGYTLDMAEFFGLSVPIASGEAGREREELPLQRISILPEDFPKGSAKDVGKPAWELLHELLEREEGVSLVAMGPLTNLAQLLERYPESKEKIQEILLVGGAGCESDVTMAAEYNFYLDPDAAKKVLEAKIPTVLCTLDAGLYAGLTRSQICKLGQMGGPAAQRLSDLLVRMMEYPVYQVQPRIPVLGAMPVMYLVHPEIFSGEKLAAYVDCSRGICRGRSLLDRRYLLDEETLHVKVLWKAQATAFQEHLIEGIFALDEILL